MVSGSLAIMPAVMTQQLRHERSPKFACNLSGSNMPEQSDEARVRDLLSRLDEISKESRSIRERIRSVRSQPPEWPAHRSVSDMFDFTPAEYDSSLPPRNDDEK